MFIQTERTPNPDTMKFIPGRTVMEAGTVEFRAADDATPSPLAQQLFMIDGVRAVFFGGDFVSVTKAPETEWLALKTMILSAIMDHFTSGQPVMTALSPSSSSQAARKGGAGSNIGDAVVAQICELLETRVRPAVQNDGGDIEFDRFEDGIVYLHMRGACSGCPSSSMTLKSGVENMLKHFVPEVREVRQADAL